VFVNSRAGVHSGVKFPESDKTAANSTVLFHCDRVSPQSDAPSAASPYILFSGFFFFSNAQFFRGIVKIVAFSSCVMLIEFWCFLLKCLVVDVTHCCNL
jgi:hypothetical protein